MTELIILALAAAAISMTVTKSTLFTAFRNKVTWKLFRCPYCLVHWVSAILILVSYSFIFSDFIISTFAVISLSILPMILIDHLNKRTGNVPQIFGPTRIGR